MSFLTVPSSGFYDNKLDILVLWTNVPFYMYQNKTERIKCMMSVHRFRWVKITLLLIFADTSNSVRKKWATALTLTVNKNIPPIPSFIFEMLSISPWPEGVDLCSDWASQFIARNEETNKQTTASDSRVSKWKTGWMSFPSAWFLCHLTVNVVLLNIQTVFLVEYKGWHTQDYVWRATAGCSEQRGL